MTTYSIVIVQSLTILCVSINSSLVFKFNSRGITINVFYFFCSFYGNKYNLSTLFIYLIYFKSTHITLHDFIAKHLLKQIWYRG